VLGADGGEARGGECERVCEREKGERKREERREKREEGERSKTAKSEIETKKEMETKKRKDASHNSGKAADEVMIPHTDLQERVLFDIALYI